MTNPWTYLGWLLVAALIVLVLSGVVWYSAKLARELALWYAKRHSRRVEPAVGQVWSSGITHLVVEKIHTDGSITLKYVGADNLPRCTIVAKEWDTFIVLNGLFVLNA